MAIGLAASDEQLARAHFKQACFDLKNGDRIITLKLNGVFALSAAQFQQCCEKGLKAVMLLEAGRELYGQRVKPSHRIWTNDLKDGRLTAVRHRLEKKLCPRAGQKFEMDEALGKMENYVPRMSWYHENTEYPWVDLVGAVCAPAIYFSEREDEVFNFGSFSRTLLKQIKFSYRSHFEAVWNEVEKIDT